MLGRVEVVRAALRAQADDVRHVDPAIARWSENERNPNGQLDCSCRSTDDGQLDHSGRQLLGTHVASPRKSSLEKLSWSMMRRMSLCCALAAAELIWNLNTSFQHGFLPWSARGIQLGDITRSGCPARGGKASASTDLGRRCSCAPGSGTARSRRGPASLQEQAAATRCATRRQDSGHRMNNQKHKATAKERNSRARNGRPHPRT